MNRSVIDLRHFSWLSLPYVFMAIILLSALGGCSGGKKVISQPAGKEPTLKPYEVFGVKYYPIPDSSGFSEKGDISWYGTKFHGRKTANGEIYDMYKMSAAHKILPMGTYVRVTNLENGKEITVRINDRGPFVKGRILDLSYAAAQQLDMIKSGVIKGKIVALGKEMDQAGRIAGRHETIIEPLNFASEIFTVQVGAFSDISNAEKLAARLKVVFSPIEISPYVSSDGSKLYRVWVGKVKNLEEAKKLEKQLGEIGFERGFIIAVN